MRVFEAAGRHRAVQGQQDRQRQPDRPERYDGYFGGPKGEPPIRHLVIHEVNDATTELTSLLGGQADWIGGSIPTSSKNRGDADAEHVAA